MKPEEELGRAERARQILEDDIFKDAVTQISEALLLGMRKSAIADDRLRDKLAVRYSVLHDIVDCLRSTMETGKLAAAQLAMDEHQRTIRERFKSYIGF